MKVLVNVTEEDIASGTHICRSCPIALAINRHLSPRFRSSVSGWIYIIAHNGDKCQELFETLNPEYEWMKAYDQMNHAEPISFELYIPNEFLVKQNES